MGRPMPQPIIVNIGERRKKQNFSPLWSGFTAPEYCFFRLLHSCSSRMPHPPNSWWRVKSLGQNVCWGHPTIQDCIQAWFDEHINYTKNGEDPLIVRPPYDPVAKRLGDNGHFTLMVGDITTKLGCGRAKSSSLFAGVVYVCNYFPNSNIQMTFRSSAGVRMETKPAYRKVRSRQYGASQ